MDLLMQLPRTFKTKKLGTIFLINNFNHVAMVCCHHSTQGLGQNSNDQSLLLDAQRLLNAANPAATM